MSEENPFAALSLFICNTWPIFQDKPLDRNAMLKAVNDLDLKLREVCGAPGQYVVDASCNLFDSKWDSFAMECEEKKVKVVFLYICSHAKLINEKTSKEDLLFFLRKGDEMTGSHLLEKIESLRKKISESKVIIFLECCNAGALYPDAKSVDFNSPLLHDEDKDVEFMSGSKRDGGHTCGLQQLPDHAAHKKVKEGSGTVLFMSCKPDESSVPCIFASSIVEILDKNKNEITAKTLVEKVSEMVLSKIRNSTTCSETQTPTFLCIPKDIEKIGIIGGCDEIELMDIDLPVESYATLGNSQLQFCWKEDIFKNKSAEAKRFLESLFTEVSEELRNPVKEVITMYENVSLETRIVFCGESGCGKSTLINAMVGYAILPCSSGHSGCTSTVIEMRENKNQNNFKAIVHIMERSSWNDEAERLRKTLTNEKCDVVDEAEELLKKIYGSSDVQDLPEDVEQLFQKGRVEIVEEKDEDLRKSLLCFVSNALEHQRQYWPIVKKIEIFVPNCDILQGGLVLVDIPGFVDPNPVRKDIAEKAYASAKNVCLCTRTARSGVNETFEKFVQDYNENLRGEKDVTFVLTRSDDEMMDAEGYFNLLGDSADDHLKESYKKVDLDSGDRNDHFRNFQIECAKHRNSKSRSTLQCKIKEDIKRPVHSVSGFDYMCRTNAKKRHMKPFFRTNGETGVPDLMSSLKQTAGNQVIVKLKRFLLECQKLPAKLENLSRTSSANFENDLLKLLTANEDERKQLFQKFHEMQEYLNEALDNDFQTARVDDICARWSNKHRMTLKAALLREGKYTYRKQEPINLNADFLENTFKVLNGKCAELVTELKPLVSSFFKKRLNVFVKSAREKHPKRKPALLTIEENGTFVEGEVCESLDKFIRILSYETSWQMLRSLQNLYAQLVQQNDFGSEALSKFVQKALDIKTKTQLKRSVHTLLEKEKFLCEKKLEEFIAVARQQMSSSLYDESVAAESSVAESIRNFKKRLDVLLEVNLKEERNHQEP